MRNKQRSGGSKVTILWAILFGLGFYSALAGLLTRHNSLTLSGLITVVSSSAIMLLMSAGND